MQAAQYRRKGRRGEARSTLLISPTRDKGTLCYSNNLSAFVGRGDFLLVRMALGVEGLANRGIMVIRFSGWAD